MCQYMHVMKFGFEFLAYHWFYFYSRSTCLFFYLVFSVLFPVAFPTFVRNCQGTHEETLSFTHIQSLTVMYKVLKSVAMFITTPCTFMSDYEFILKNIDVCHLKWPKIPKDISSSYGNVVILIH